MSSDPHQDRGVSAGGCVLRILAAGVVLVALGAAVYALVPFWSGMESEANPNLDPVRRAYLEVFLRQHTAELQAPAGTGSEPVTFTIAPGEGATAIAEKLHAAGLLNNTELFLNYLAYYGLDGRLLAGDYTLDPRSTIPELADSLGSGRGQLLEVSFLPGWRSEEMARYLSVVSPARIDAAVFLEIVRSGRGIRDHSGFLASMPEGASLEGYLFPGIYPIGRETTSGELVDMMLARFNEQVTPAMRQAYGSKGLSLRDAVILASIIQKEAALSEEKPLMAAAFLNRLQAGMPLQADPTVQYAVGYQAETDTWWKVPLSAGDLQVDSPYNTYLYNGLPPGPITNPGLDSLQAVANPAAVSYLFFVLDCAAPTPGAHIFSVSYEEHVANVQRCR